MAWCCDPGANGCAVGSTDHANHACFIWGDVGGSVTMGSCVTLRRNCRDSIAVVGSRSRHNYIASIYMYIKYTIDLLSSSKVTCNEFQRASMTVHKGAFVDMITNWIQYMVRGAVIASRHSFSVLRHSGKAVFVLKLQVSNVLPLSAGDSCSEGLCHQVQSHA